MKQSKAHIETSIKSLKFLLDELSEGILRIPPFQRDFIWQRDDIKSLLDSIRHNYPIGSIILWKPSKEMNFDNVSVVGSYSIPSNNGNTYVLDGYQRLSALFGCLTNPESTELPRDEEQYANLFEIYYNLEDEVFEYLRPHTKSNNSQVPLYVLMSSKDFRQYTRKYIEQKLFKDDYLDRADDLTRVLIDYQVPVIEIANADIDEAVDIFSRINSKGTDISYDWMANALSYSQGKFRFADVIDELKEELAEYNFDGVGRNALFRCFQSSFGKLYIDQKNIEDLAKREDFAETIKEAKKHIKTAVSYLYHNLNVTDYKLLPYNTQLIFFMEFLKRLPDPSEKQLKDLEEWFWVTTYSNFFTNYSLAYQRKAYNTFIDYLTGRSENILYDGSFEYSTLPFPLSINLNAVRSRALILFCLNRFPDDSGNKEFVQRKVYSIDQTSPETHKSTANILFSTQKSYFETTEISDDIFSSMSDKDREKLFFVDEEAYDLYKNNMKKAFLNRRLELLKRSEKDFIDTFECLRSKHDEA